MVILRRFLLPTISNHHFLKAVSRSLDSLRCTLPYTSKQNNLHSTLSNPGVGFGLVLCSPPKMGVNTYQDDLLSNQNGSKLMASNGFPSNKLTKRLLKKKTFSRWITYKKLLVFNGYVTMWLSLRKVALKMSDSAFSEASGSTTLTEDSKLGTK